MASEVTENTKRHGRIKRYVPLLLWIGVIFFFSSGQGSMSQTSRFLGPLLAFLFPEASGELLLIIHGIIRKGAHVFEYGVLALIAARAFSTSARDTLRKYWVPAALVLVGTAACADELNQSFQSSRTGSGWDVLLDLAGGSAGILLYWLIAGRVRAGESRRARPA